MGVAVDFTQTNQVFQAANSIVEWITTWAMDNNHFYGYSSVPDSNQSSLKLLSLRFENDLAGNVSLHPLIQAGPTNAVFRGAMIQAPNKW
jgi:hypothetical protein